MCRRVLRKRCAQPLIQPRCGARVVSLKLHEQLGVVGRVIADNMVVVNLRIAMPEVGKVAAHFARLCQALFDKAQGTIGSRKTAAVGQLDADQKLRRIRLGKQAAAQQLRHTQR